MKKLFSLILILLLINPIVSYADTPIQGKPSATQSQVMQWLEDKNVGEGFTQYVPYIYKYSEKIGIDPVIVICQTMLETGYFKSSTLEKYHNTAGIKNRKNTSIYQYYDTYKDGLTAQMNHLALYCGLPQEGYYYSSRLDGWVTTVEQLSGTWAEDLKYSDKILSMMSQVYSYNSIEKETVVKKKEEPIKKLEEKKKTGTSIIYDKLKKKEKSKGYKKIMQYIK